MSYYLSHGIASTVLGLPFCWLADKHKFWVVDKSLIIQMWSFHDDRWCISLEVWDLYPSFFIIPPSKTCEKMYTYIQRLEEVKNCDGKKRWQWQCKHPTNSRMSRSCSLKTRFLQHSNSSTSRNHTCQHCHRPVKRTAWGKCSAWRWLSLQPSQMFPAQPQIEKNNSDKLQHTNHCDVESNAYFCNLWSQNQPKKACGKLRTLEDSCGQQLENPDVIHLHPSPMLQGELLLFCFVLLHLFDFLTVTWPWHCNILKKLREKKTCRMILNFVCHSTLPMMKRCRGCPKQTKRHKTVYGTAGRCVLNWGSSQWHHSCNDLNQERSIQDHQDLWHSQMPIIYRHMNIYIV